MTTTAIVVAVLVVLVAWRALPPRPTGRRQGTGASGGTGADAGAPSPALHVATFNIHRGKGRGGARNPHRTAAALEGVDVAGLQECAGSSLVRSRNHAAMLARQLGLRWLFAPSQDRWFLRAHGNALLSRLPVGRWSCEPLPGHSRRAPRNILSANLVFGGKPVTVLVTHLSRESDRDPQLATVLDRLRECERGILLADLNETRDHVRLAGLSNDGVLDAIGAALGAADDADRIDWILTRGFRVHGGSVVDEGASDHPCYRVHLSLREIRS